MTQFARLNRSLLSPLFAFSAVWLLGALVSQYHLLNSQIDWSEYMVLVVLVVPVAFVAGGLVGEGVAVRISAAREGRRDLDRSSRLLRRILIAFLILGLAELTHQFIKIGGVPLLSPQGNTLRFDQGGPTIILTDLLTVAAIVALVKPRNPFARESRFEMGIALVALGGFALQAGRGSLILPVIVATAARWLYWGRPKATWLGAAGLITFAAVVFGFYIRTKQNPYNPFEAELYGEVLPDTPFYLQALIPLHLAISTNFLALQGLVSFFPTAEPFGAGSYDALGLHHIISGAQNVQDVSAALTPPWVTSTVAGPFWADGGFAALIPGIAMTGFASAGAFAMSMRTRSFRWSLVAGYLLYLALFGVYTNLWTQQIDWILIVPLLLIVGAVGEDPSSPPGVTGWAWARIKRMSGRGGGAPREPAKKRRPLRREKRLALGLVGAGAAVVVLLVVSGLLIQPLIPEPYPLYFTTSLPRSAARSVAVVTDSDRPQDNERLRWVTRSGHGVRVFAYQPTQEEGVAHRSPLIQIPGDVGKASFDVAKWGPWRSMALFSFQQHKKLLSVRVGPTAPDEGAPEESRRRSRPRPKTRSETRWSPPGAAPSPICSSSPAAAKPPARYSRSSPASRDSANRSSSPGSRSAASGRRAGRSTSARSGSCRQRPQPRGQGRTRRPPAGPTHRRAGAQRRPGSARRVGLPVQRLPTRPRHQRNGAPGHDLRARLGPRGDRRLRSPAEPSGRAAPAGVRGRQPCGFQIAEPDPQIERFEAAAPPEVGALGRSAARGVSLLVVRTLGFQLLTVGVTVVLARLLTPADYGLFAIALSVQLVGQNFAELGLPAALVRMPEPPPRLLQESTIGFMLTVTLTASVCLFAVVFGVVPALGEPSKLLRVIAITLLALPLYGVRAVPMAMMDREMSFGRVAAVEAADTIGFNVFALLAALAGLGVFSLAGAVPFGAMLGVGVAWAVQRSAGARGSTSRGSGP